PTDRSSASNASATSSCGASSSPSSQLADHGGSDSVEQISPSSRTSTRATSAPTNSSTGTLPVTRPSHKVANAITYSVWLAFVWLAKGGGCARRRRRVRNRRPKCTTHRPNEMHDPPAEVHDPPAEVHDSPAK